MKTVLRLALLSVIAAGCSNSTEPPLLDPVEALAARERMVEAYTGFGLELFRRVAAERGDENVFLSPSSVAFALSMTYNGASGETRDAMARVLRVQGLSLDALNHANREWREALSNPDPEVELAIANSLWAREGAPFRAEFLERTREHFDARVTTLDFGDPAASGIINEWVSRSTEGRIEEIVPARIDPLTVMYLINAIYFRGEWADPFDPRATRALPWHLSAGGTVEVPMMTRDGTYATLDGDGFTGVALPYGEGRVRMYILLPDEGSSVEALRQRLSAEEWERWMDGFTPGRVMLTLPRFRTEFEASLVDALSALGMEVAFDASRADFGDMLPEEFLRNRNAYLSDVRHKTFLEVTEWGTEAAGVTSVEVSVTSMPPSVVVDRPFVLAIRDDRTGTVLFLGQIADPR